MAKKGFVQIKISTILLLVLFALIFFLHFSSNKKFTYPKQYPKPCSYVNPAPLPQSYYNPRRAFLDPLTPPLKDNKFYANRVGIPINVPTQTVDADYSSVGILTRISGKEMILPLFGRPLHLGRDKWQYYAADGRGNNIKLPVSNAGKSCTGEYGCDSISNGDTIYVEGYNDSFKATIYENRLPRYIPYVY
jgi:hypothetical protein